VPCHHSCGPYQQDPSGEGFREGEGIALPSVCSALMKPSRGLRVLKAYGIRDPGCHSLIANDSWLLKLALNA